MIQPDLSAERSEGECARWIAARTIIGRCNPGVIAYGTTDTANAQHKDVALHRPLSIKGHRPQRRRLFARARINACESRRQWQ